MWKGAAVRRGRRDLHARSHGQAGFTLIELLVAIIIIGILSSIAIPVFLNHRKAALDASVKADLHNLLIAIGSAMAGGQVSSYAHLTPDMVRAEGFRNSPGNVLIACWGYMGDGEKLSLYGRNNETKHVFRLFDAEGGQGGRMASSGPGATLDYTGCPDDDSTPGFVDTWPIGTTNPAVAPPMPRVARDGAGLYLTPIVSDPRDGGTP